MHLTPHPSTPLPTPTPYLTTLTTTTTLHPPPHPLPPAQAGLNAYSALTTDDFAEVVLMTPAATATGTTAAAKTSGSRKLLAKYGTIPTYPSLINWVNAGKVLPAPGFQAACGSSWAFAAAGALESKLMIDSKLNTTAALSPQNIMVSSRGVACTDWGGVSSSSSSLGRPQEAHHSLPPLPLTLQDCTARMFAYTDFTCNGGSLTDAFQYAAERGVTADDGAWGLGRIWGRRESSVRERCQLACLPRPSPPACRVLQTHRILPAHLSPHHPTPPHPTPAAYRYRSATPGNDADAKGFLLQCDRAFLTGRAARAGLVRISATPAFKQVSPASNKVALITALAAQPAVTTLAMDASFQHYAGGIWTSTACGGCGGGMQRK